MYFCARVGDRTEVHRYKHILGKILFLHKGYLQILYSVSRVNLETCKINICSVPNFSMWKNVSGTLLQFPTSLYGHVYVEG